MDELAYVDMVLILDADMNADTSNKTHMTGGKLLILIVRLPRDFLEA
jgi:hypothetical protein